MAINIFVLKGDLNGENRSGAFLFLSGIYCLMRYSLCQIIVYLIPKLFLCVEFMTGYQFLPK